MTADEFGFDHDNGLCSTTIHRIDRNTTVYTMIYKYYYSVYDG